MLRHPGAGPAPSYLPMQQAVQCTALRASLAEQRLAAVQAHHAPPAAAQPGSAVGHSTVSMCMWPPPIWGQASPSRADGRHDDPQLLWPQSWAASTECPRGCSLLVGPCSPPTPQLDTPVATAVHGCNATHGWCGALLILPGQQQAKAVATGEMPPNSGRCVCVCVVGKWAGLQA